MSLKRESFSSGILSDETKGFSGMIKIGPYIRIGGTMALNVDGTVCFPGDSYEQVRFIFERQLKLLAQAGGSLSDVYAVRCFGVGTDASGFKRAFSETFNQIKPSCTRIGIATLHRDGLTDIIELEALIGSGAGKTLEGTAVDLTRHNYGVGFDDESQVGYSSAVKIGPYVRISGSCARNPDGSPYAPGVPGEQTTFILQNHVKLLQQIGGTIQDVHGIRCYAVNDPTDEFGAAYSKIFREYRPISTKIGVASMPCPENNTQIEMEAVIGSGSGQNLAGTSISLARQSYSSGVPLENQLGYSRMIRIGNYVRIGGTAAAKLDDDGAYAPFDTYAQTKFIVEKFKGLLKTAGASMSDVYAIRAFTCEDYEDNFGKACCECFKDSRPLVTKVGISALHTSDLRVEIELEAFIGSGN